MNDKSDNLGGITSTYLGELFSTPFIAAAAQLHPSTASIAAYFSTQYAKDQAEAQRELISLMVTKLQHIESRFLDRDFFETQDGRRIAVQIVLSVRRDFRKAKIQAMANLAVNLHLKSKLSVDEKELFVSTLDTLNPLQLSLLDIAIQDMRKRTTGTFHRGFGWEHLNEEFSQKGVSKHLLLQSIRVLESNGLVNQNDATVVEVDKTHFITDFGEQFYDFIVDALKTDSLYLYAS